MRKSPAKLTTAGNLEAKFDAGEDVVDYFDLPSAKLVPPKRKVAATSGRRAAGERSRAAVPLERALKIAAKIEKLGSELRSILGKQEFRAERTRSA